MTTPKKPTPLPAAPTKNPPNAAPPVGAIQETKPTHPDPVPNPLKAVKAPEFPTPKRKPGRPLGSKTRVVPGTPEAIQPVDLPTGKAKRPLPEDPGALELALKPLKVQVAPIVDAVGNLCAVVPPGLPLQPAEKDALTEAGASVMYVYGGHIDPLLGLALVLASIALPRATMYFAWKRNGGELAEAKAA